jgi:HNH endonuclease
MAGFHESREMMLTQKRLRELLDYDPVTGWFTWRVNKNDHASKGKRAGQVHPLYGYRCVCLDGRHYRMARLAFLWMTGEWPKPEADHKNCVRADDRWDNLRSANRQQNLANSKPRGQSGLKGVTWTKGKYQAAIRVNCRTIYLGRFDDPQSAHAAYVAAASKHFGQFAREA